MEDPKKEITDIGSIEEKVNKILEDQERIKEALEEIQEKLNDFDPSNLSTIIESLAKIEEKIESKIATPAKRTTKSASGNPYKISLKQFKKMSTKSKVKKTTTHGYELHDSRYYFAFWFIPGVKFRDHMIDKGFKSNQINEELLNYKNVIVDILTIGLFNWVEGAKSYEETVELLAKRKPPEEIKDFKISMDKLRIGCKGKLDTTLDCLIECIKVAKGTSQTQAVFKAKKEEFGKFFKKGTEMATYIVKIQNVHFDILKPFGQIGQPTYYVPFPFNYEKSVVNGYEINKTIFWYLVGKNAPEKSELKKFFSFPDFPEKFIKEPIPKPLYLNDKEWEEYTKSHPKGDEDVGILGGDQEGLLSALIGEDESQTNEL